MTPRAALYLRVSTTDQDLEGQGRDVRLAADRAGHEIAWVFAEKVSATGRKERPEYDRMVAAAARGEFVHVWAWSLDRFSREDRFTRAIDAILDLEKAGIRFHFLKDPSLDTPAPGEDGMAREILLALLPVIAKYEAVRRRERTQLAMDDIKAGRRKTRSGKPPHRPIRVTEEKAEAIDRMRAQGLPWASVAQKVGLPKGTCRWVHSERRRGRWKARTLERVSTTGEPAPATDREPKQTLPSATTGGNP